MYFVIFGYNVLSAFYWRSGIDGQCWQFSFIPSIIIRRHSRDWLSLSFHFLLWTFEISAFPSVA
jgi:hypothetical protein